MVVLRDGNVTTKYLRLLSVFFCLNKTEKNYGIASAFSAIFTFWPQRSVVPYFRCPFAAAYSIRFPQHPPESTFQSIMHAATDSILGVFWMFFVHFYETSQCLWVQTSNVCGGPAWVGETWVEVGRREAPSVRGTEKKRTEIENGGTIRGGSCNNFLEF